MHADRHARRARARGARAREARAAGEARRAALDRCRASRRCGARRADLVHARALHALLARLGLAAAARRRAHVRRGDERRLPAPGLAPAVVELLPRSAAHRRRAGRPAHPRRGLRALALRRSRGGREHGLARPRHDALPLRGRAGARRRGGRVGPRGGLPVPHALHRRVRAGNGGLRPGTHAAAAPGAGRQGRGGRAAAGERVRGTGEALPRRDHQRLARAARDARRCARRRAPARGRARERRALPRRAPLGADGPALPRARVPVRAPRSARARWSRSRARAGSTSRWDRGTGPGSSAWPGRRARPRR